jgi:tryptophan 2,3-dioxygenase
VGPSEVRGARFGREGGELSYGSYLRVPELLSLQSLKSSPPAHDELLFIVVHQAYELWFKQMIFELESVRDRLLAGDAHAARHGLSRVHAIERVITEHIGVIETMTPQDFLEFRSNLAPGSGFQSVQFREIEAISGLREPELVASMESSDEERGRLERRWAEPTVWDAFCAVLEAGGLPMPADDEGARRESLLAMARAGERDLFSLSDDLLTHDELFALWRYHHVLMVEREIGSKSGTGGSSGASYLRTTLDKRFYPELWALRSYL